MQISASTPQPDRMPPIVISVDEILADLMYPVPSAAGNR